MRLPSTSAEKVRNWPGRKANGMGPHSGPVSRNVLTFGVSPKIAATRRAPDHGRLGALSGAQAAAIAGFWAGAAGAAGAEGEAGVGAATGAAGPAGAGAGVGLPARAAAAAPGVSR